jgi:polyphosphate kinase 2 (PPK2 family)
VDDLDEELELELEDEPPMKTSANEAEQPSDQSFRKFYFRELLRLQVELVKLQDWVVATGQKIVVIFEGRDAAGKGGAIKRLTQRLNPRVCRVAALPHRTAANARNGIFNAMLLIFRPREKSSASIGAGTIGPELSM